MKLKVLLLFFLFFTIDNYSQNENDKIVYFDSTYQQNIKIGNSFYSTSVDNETKNMGNYRIIKDYNIQQKKYTIIDYYKSGKTKAKGTTLNKNTICIHDELIQYYENGNKKISTNYFGGIKLGKEYEWYENGNIKTKKNFIATEDQFKTTCIIDAFWDKMGNEKVKNGKGYYEEERKDYYSEGGIKEGLKDGLWKGWVGNVENKFSEFYIKGILKSGVIKTENNIESKYYEIENYAVPKKGHKHFYNFIKEKCNCLVIITKEYI